MPDETQITPSSFVTSLYRWHGLHSWWSLLGIMDLPKKFFYCFCWLSLKFLVSQLRLLIRWHIKLTMQMSRFKPIFKAKLKFILRSGVVFFLIIFTSKFIVWFSTDSLFYKPFIFLHLINSNFNISKLKISNTVW